MKQKLMALATFMVIGASLGFIGPPMFGDEWDRLRPIVTGLVCAVVFLFVFAASYRGIVQRRGKP
jgi:O-antigen/teichoic acid export membrane protein